MSELDFAEPDPDQYNAFIAGLTLAEVQLVKVTGERKAAGEPLNLGFAFGGGFHCDGDRLQIRYDVTVNVLGADSAVLTEVQASVVVVMTMASAGTPDCYNRFAASSGALMAHPYLREVVQSTAARLGHPAVILPIATAVPAGPLPPAEAAVE